MTPIPTPTTEPDAGEEHVRRFYERAPYPDLGVLPKNPQWLEFLAPHLPGRPALRFLEAGCGTGHGVVGAALRHPQWRYFALDLSQPSLDIATKLAAMHGVSVDFARGSYQDALPWSEPFDVISCSGTIHHAEDPPGAVANLLAHLADDGFIFIHLYGKDLDRGKFVIREILDIMEPDIGAVETRFRLYEQLLRARRPGLVQRLLDLSPRVVLRAVRDLVRNRLRTLRGESWSPSWTATYARPDAPWVDHFCHPLERSYDVRDVQALAEASGLEVLWMLNQGAERPERLPPEWREAWARLDAWSRWRLMELLDITARSVSLIGRRRDAGSNR